MENVWKITVNYIYWNHPSLNVFRRFCSIIIRYNGSIIVSGSPHQRAEKARCCWQHRSRKALWLCGCHWSYAIRWIRPMPSSCRGLQTHWAERLTLGWWAPRCWPRSTQMIGCCLRMMRGNWWEDGGDKWALETSWSRARRLRKS